MDAVAALTTAPLRALPERWRLPTQAALLAEARAAEAAGPDDYWAWAAQRLRWQRPWDRLREGDLGNFRYYRRRPAQRRRQLRRPPRREPGHRGPRRRRLGGRAWRRAPTDLPRAARPSGSLRQRLARAGRAARRRGGDPPAEPAGGLRRHPRLQPHRRDLHRAVQRLRAGRHPAAAASVARRVVVTADAAWRRGRAGALAGQPAGGPRRSGRRAPHGRREPHRLGTRPAAPARRAGMPCSPRRRPTARARRWRRTTRRS